MELKGVKGVWIEERVLKEEGRAERVDLRNPLNDRL